MVPKPHGSSQETPRVAACDVQALFEEHGAYVRGVVARLLGPNIDPDDVTQEVFIIAWRRIAKLHGGDARAWLRGIAVHRAATFHRRRRLWRLLGLESVAEPVDKARDPEQRAQLSEATHLAYRILESMSEKRRTVFILFELHGMTGDEIAAALDCPVETVHTRLYYARREFRERIDREPAGARFDPPRRSRP